MNQTTGQQAEQIAGRFLRKKKLKILTTNYHSRWGEIDIIALDGDILAFIEVRYRQSNSFGDAGETVNNAKQQRIIKTAQHYLTQTTKHQQRDCRFDIVSLSGSLEQPEIEWFKAAFTA